MKIAKGVAVLALAVSPLLVAGCSASKPSVDEVHTAVVKLFKTQGGSGISDSQAEAFADCAAPKFYDELSADTLNELVQKGVDRQGDSEDAAAEKIPQECAKEVVPSS